MTYVTAHVIIIIAFNDIDVTMKKRGIVILFINLRAILVNGERVLNN